jgi:sister chromatid cohesion protein PDS5
MFLDLQQAATCLTDMDQSPSASALESMKPFLNAIVKPELLKHQDRDVKLLVATCVCEITRITAPEAPYSDDVLKVPSIYPSYLIMLIRFFIYFWMVRLS